MPVANLPFHSMSQGNYGTFMTSEFFYSQNKGNSFGYLIGGYDYGYCQRVRFINGTFYFMDGDLQETGNLYYLRKTDGNIVKCNGFASTTKVFDVCSFDGRYFAAALYSYIYMSNNGIDWYKSSPLGTSSYNNSKAWAVRGFATNGTILVAVTKYQANSGLYGAYYTTGWNKVWNRGMQFSSSAVLNVDGGNTINFCDVAYGNGIFIAIADNSYAYKSSDGKSWTRMTGATCLTKIAYGNGVFIAMDIDGKNYYTTGSSWTSISSISFTMDGSYTQTTLRQYADRRSFCYGDGVFLYQGLEKKRGSDGLIGNSIKLLYSENGINWNVIDYDPYKDKNIVRYIPTYYFGKSMAYGNYN